MSEMLNDTTYIGQQKVMEFVAIEGTDKVTFNLENGRKDDCTMDQYLAMISPTTYPDGEVSVRKWKPAIDQIMDIFLANDLELMDKDFVLGQIESRVVNSANKGTAKLWGVDNMMHVSLRDIDKVLKQNIENKTEPSA